MNIRFSYNLLRTNYAYVSIKVEPLSAHSTDHNIVSLLTRTRAKMKAYIFANLRDFQVSVT
jgi:hypothetical protein